MPTYSSELLADFEAALRPRLTGSLRMDALSRSLYSTDASMYRIEPIGVLLPAHSDDVQAALEAAAAFGLPVLPRGGGSSLAGQAVGAALVVDFTRHCDAILDVNPEARRARVQPGVVLDTLNAALRPHGLQVGPDPSSSNRATLGGMLATNATGAHSILYGSMVHHVQAVRALLDDGTDVHFAPLDTDAWQRRTGRAGREGDLYRRLDALLELQAPVIRARTPAHWRRAGGYRIESLLDEGPRNLAHLLCGSEGTLAIATEIELGLVAAPRGTALGVVHFATRRAALEAVPRLLETEPSAIELFDGVAIERARLTPGFAGRLGFIDGTPGGVLIVEYYGASAAELDARLADLQAVAGSLPGSYTLFALTDPAAVRDVWSVRKETLGLVMGVKGDYKPVAFIEDASVPVEHLADYIDELAALLVETDTRATVYAHASAGCLHVRPFVNTKDLAEVRKMKELSVGSMQLVAKYGGMIASEHGDGLARSWLNPEFYGPALYAVYRGVKEAFDPAGRLNPGKIVDAPPMDTHLRMGPSYRTVQIDEVLDYTDDFGFARAVELCNGCGACRKLNAGTMCPSFMVTREEKDSTRGRANALRDALSGALPPGALTGEVLQEAMDLCIQCKACKTECPSGVDMARLKAEWLHHRWQDRPPPFRTRLFAHLPALSARLSGSLARGVNWLNSRNTTRSFLDRWVGIDRRRALPDFAGRSFTDWYERDYRVRNGPPVLLFVDTFHNYHHPEVAQAAAELLGRAGYRVLLPERRLCCGRTLFSAGLLTDAQLQALHTVDVLYPHVDAGVPVVCLEPSCLSMLQDDYPALLPGELRARRVSAGVQSFEAFVAVEAEHGRFAGLTWTDDARRVVLHGHCHQKALVGTGPAERALALPPGYTVETVDSGCCGMAGSFGYEKEHYDTSVAMAERRLAPAVRAADENTLVAAAGTSCRAQIHDLTGRTALHPAQILNAALVSE